METIFERKFCPLSDTMDILAGLPKTKEGYQYILLVTDSFSHWAEAFPLKTQEAQEIADSFIAS
jgi:hypothetical protein